MKIWTRGYRGPGTQYAYLPAGEYEIADADDWQHGKVRRELADEMLAISLARVTEADAENSEPLPGELEVVTDLTGPAEAVFDASADDDEPAKPARKSRKRE